MSFYFVDNSDPDLLEVHEDMSHDAQMERIEAKMLSLEDSALTIHKFDLTHPMKMAKQGFVHKLRLGNFWNHLGLDDKHKEIMWNRLHELKIGRKSLSKVEHAKKGEVEDIRIFWK